MNIAVASTLEVAMNIAHYAKQQVTVQCRIMERHAFERSFRSSGIFFFFLVITHDERYKQTMCSLFKSKVLETQRSLSVFPTSVLDNFAACKIVMWPKIKMTLSSWCYCQT